MSLINSVLKVFVGDRTKKDLKLLQPIVDKVRAFDNEMEKYSIESRKGK